MPPGSSMYQNPLTTPPLAPVLKYVSSYIHTKYIYYITPMMLFEALGEIGAPDLGS